jgi:hypothetical protein
VAAYAGDEGVAQNHNTAGRNGTGERPLANSGRAGRRQRRRRGGVLAGEERGADGPRGLAGERDVEADGGGEEGDGRRPLDEQVDRGAGRAGYELTDRGGGETVHRAAVHLLSRVARASALK